MRLSRSRSRLQCSALASILKINRLGVWRLDFGCWRVIYSVNYPSALPTLHWDNSTSIWRPASLRSSSTYYYISYFLCSVVDLSCFFSFAFGFCSFSFIRKSKGARSSRDWYDHLSLNFFFFLHLALSFSSFCLVRRLWNQAYAVVGLRLNIEPRAFLGFARGFLRTSIDCRLSVLLTLDNAIEKQRVSSSVLVFGVIGIFFYLWISKQRSSVSVGDNSIPFPLPAAEYLSFSSESSHLHLSIHRS